MTEKDRRQAEFLRNRVLKNEARLRKWARREEVFAYRLYDRDIPEIPLAVDFYRALSPLSGAGDSAEPSQALLIALYERPYEKDGELEAEWLGLMADTLGEAFGLPEEAVFSRRRKRQRGKDQYERQAEKGSERLLREGGLSFIVNLSDYLDTGLFLDHRSTRARIRGEAAGKRVLNLFCYTGSFSVYAAAGGASSVTSVDLSNTYLGWAERNLALNGFSGSAYPLVRAEARSFLKNRAARGEKWDLIVADPPTFSNSKAAPEDFDVNRDWPALVGSCLDLLSPGGNLYFSTNSRRLSWDSAAVPARVEELGDSSLPPDFRDRKIHRAWKIQKPA